MYTHKLWSIWIICINTIYTRHIHFILIDRNRFIKADNTGLIPGLHPANERRGYKKRRISLTGRKTRISPVIWYCVSYFGAVGLNLIPPRRCLRRIQICLDRIFFFHSKFNTIPHKICCGEMTFRKLYTPLFHVLPWLPPWFAQV